MCSCSVLCPRSVRGPFESIFRRYPRSAAKPSSLPIHQGTCKFSLLKCILEKTRTTYSSCCRQIHIITLRYNVITTHFMHFLLQKQLYLIHKRENPQVYLFGIRPKVWLVPLVFPWAWTCAAATATCFLWQQSAPPPGGMTSRAGVWQGVQHHVALVHVTLQSQRESQRGLQHHFVLIREWRFQGRDAAVF